MLHSFGQRRLQPVLKNYRRVVELEDSLVLSPKAPAMASTLSRRAAQVVSGTVGLEICAKWARSPRHRDMIQGLHFWQLPCRCAHVIASSYEDMTQLHSPDTSRVPSLVQQGSSESHTRPELKNQINLSLSLVSFVLTMCLLSLLLSSFRSSSIITTRARS